MGSAAVVAIGRNVDGADGSIGGGVQFRGESVGETRAAADDTDQGERAGVGVAMLDDFVGDALDAAGDGVGVEGGLDAGVIAAPWSAGVPGKEIPAYKGSR